MKFFIKKKLSLLLGASLMLWLLGSLAGSRLATLPRPKVIPPASQYFSQTVENHTFMAKDRVEISAWYLPNDGKKAVIILNGIGANRLTMVQRAKFYHKRGYDVVLPDLRGTGASGGDRITFGWKERYDLEATVDFLEKKGMEAIAVHGISMGAATIVYSLQDQPDYDFVVLESCYDNITNALENRVEQFYLPSIFYSALSKFVELRIEASEKDLRPEDYLHGCSAPTFIMAGDAEWRVKKEETEKLFAKCGAETKQLHFFKDARHVNFYKNYEIEWERVMTGWLSQVEVSAVQHEGTKNK